MSVITFRRRAVAPFPWRTVGLIAVLAMLLAAVVFYVGSQPRLPAPFGLAANGLVAYAKNGDIFTVDPTTGSRRWITSGPDQDREPHWSRDGTRIAFLRGSRLTEVLVIVDRERNVIAQTVPVADVDTDTISWSPDGSSITIASGSHGLSIVDTTDGGLTPVRAQFSGLDVHWRPPDGRQLLLLGEAAVGVGLLLVDMNDPSRVQVVAQAGSGEMVRPADWTPDGRKVVYSRVPLMEVEGETNLDETRTHVLDLTTNTEVVILAGHAHVSNDGKRVLALDASGRPCVASIDGGPCIQIGEASAAYVGSHAAGASWAPDDEWILIRPDVGARRTILLDPAGGIDAQPGWLADGAESWQRLAP